MTLGQNEGYPQEFIFVKRLRGSIESIKNALLASLHGVGDSIPNPITKVKGPIKGLAFIRKPTCSF